ncbi:MAG: DUF2059 domain-containing protein [Alphaproteobacteria bacterium]
MFLKFHRVRVSLAGAALLALSIQGLAAQEITQSHLDAAIRVTAVAPTIGDFDALLPMVSQSVQNRLIRERPDLFREISATVEEQALLLSSRRSDLATDMARVWARRFTEPELDQISGFFGSDLGARYKEVLPTIGEEILRLSRSWADRVSDELLERAAQELKNQGHKFN